MGPGLIARDGPGGGWQLVDTRVVDMAFQNIGGTSYLTGHDTDGAFQWATLSP